MPRYIDADKLKKHYSWWADAGLQNEKADMDQIVDSIPTADVQEVKHGIWSEYADRDFDGNLFYTYTCSCCNKVFYHNYNYCPNCGARMDGDKE